MKESFMKIKLGILLFFGIILAEENKKVSPDYNPYFDAIPTDASMKKDFFAIYDEFSLQLHNFVTQENVVEEMKSILDDAIKSGFFLANSQETTFPDGVRQEYNMKVIFEIIIDQKLKSIFEKMKSKKLLGK